MGGGESLAYFRQTAGRPKMKCLLRKFVCSKFTSMLLISDKPKDWLIKKGSFLLDPSGTDKRTQERYVWVQFLGKSKRGLTNAGLSPKFSEKMGGNSSWKIGPSRGKLGPLRGRSGPFRGRSGPIPPHPTATGEEQKLPRKGPFWPNWRLSGQAPVC